MRDIETELARQQLDPTTTDLEVRHLLITCTQTAAVPRCRRADERLGNHPHHHHHHHHHRHLRTLQSFGVRVRYL